MDFYRGRGGEQQPSAGYLAGPVSIHVLAPALTHMINRIPQARARIQEAQHKIAEAIKQRRSEQARTWMEKHIRDFKRGHELESAAATD